MGGGDYRGGYVGGSYRDGYWRFGGPWNFDPEAIRQMRREVRERTGELRNLATLIEQSGADPRELQTMLDAMRALDQEGTYADPEEVLRLQSQLVEGAKQLEYRLRREYAQEEEQDILLFRSGDIPEEYRLLVEEYYRVLSRTGRDGR